MTEITPQNAARLRLILANAVRKEADGLPLTVLEEELLAELHRKQSENRRESVHVDADGTVHVNKTIDAEPVMEAMKGYGDFIDRHSKRKKAQQMVGSIDPITAANWMKECGAKIGTKEFAQFAIKRLKNDIDYRRFRVGG